MKKAVLVVVAALALAGCANLKNAWTVATSATVSVQGVTVAVNVFDTIEATATNYLRLPKCIAGGSPVCRNPSIATQVITAIKAGRIARNNLEAFLAGHTTALGVQGDYDALQAAVTTLQAILAQYGKVS